MNFNDLKDLEEKYSLAIEATNRITPVENGYFDYPDEISVFMSLLIKEPWVNHNYKPSEVSKIFSSIESATLGEVKSVLTGTSRSERFSSGCWKAALESRRLDPALKRLNVILNA
jgi:hypothetical protein